MHILCIFRTCNCIFDAYNCTFLNFSACLLAYLCIFLPDPFQLARLRAVHLPFQQALQQQFRVHSSLLASLCRFARVCSPGYGDPGAPPGPAHRPRPAGLTGPPPGTPSRRSRPLRHLHLCLRRRSRPAPPPTPPRSGEPNSPRIVNQARLRLLLQPPLPKPPLPPQQPGSDQPTTFSIQQPAARVLLPHCALL